MRRSDAIMVLCLIVGCGFKTGRDKGVYFARVPQIVTTQGEEAKKLSELRRKKWISAISRDDLSESVLNDGGRVCGKHFVSGKAAKSWDKFNPDWVPSLNLGHNKSLSGEKLETGLEAAAEREKRQRSRELKRAERERLDGEQQLEEETAEKKRKLDEPGLEIRDVSFVECDGEQECEEETGIGTQTDEFDYLFACVPDKPFDEDWFTSDDEKVNFYTGLPGFDILKVVFRHVSPHVGRKSMTLTKFQEFSMTLMKLKLNVPMQDLAYRFSVSRPSVCIIFSAWMIVMEARLAPVISWPEREDLWRTMPQCFQFSFGKKATVVIDCFEVFINRPSNLLARAQTYSSYKSHNTVKVLIGITPQGSISFISKAWGGRTSDKYLTEHCKILDKLLPGDLVLADRGFTIHEGIIFKRAELAIPAFTKGKDQLDPVDVEKTRGIANVRIHVERVIGLLRRKYTILSGILPITFLICDSKGSQTAATPMIDRIITVTAALTNLCQGIVPFD